MKIKRKVKFQIYLTASILIFLTLIGLLVECYFRYEELPADWGSTVFLENYKWQYGSALDYIMTLLACFAVYTLIQIILGIIAYNKLKKATLEKRKIYFHRRQQPTDETHHHHHHHSHEDGHSENEE